MKVILNNKIELNAITVTGAKEFIENAYRDCLTFVFPEMSLDELDNAFTETNCESITLIGDDGTENIHNGYVIRTNLTKKKVILQDQTVDADEISEKRCFVTMAQRVYSDKKLAEIEAQNLDLALAIAELGVLIAGGNE